MAVIRFQNTNLRQMTMVVEDTSTTNFAINKYTCEVRASGDSIIVSYWNPTNVGGKVEQYVWNEDDVEEPIHTDIADLIDKVNAILEDCAEGGSGGTPSPLTKNDDTNVTLTLGGTPSTALLESVSLSLGWTGTLADNRISSADTWNAKQSALGYTPLNPANNLSEVTPTTARTNLGLGTAATTANTDYVPKEFLFWEYVKAGVNYSAAVTSLANTTLSSTNNVIRATWLIVPKSVSLLSFKINVTVASTAGGLARIGIFTLNNAQTTLTRVQDLGTVAIDSLGLKTITTTVALTKGVYFLGVVTSLTATISALQLASITPILGTNATTQISGVTSNFTFGAFAATHAVTTLATSAQPLVYFTL